MKGEFFTSVGGCARCGEDHERVTFYEFERPPQDDSKTTHWGTCPTSGDPILMSVRTVD